MAEEESVSTPAASAPPPSSEDAETRATRRELRQHHISDDANNSARPETPAEDITEDSLKEQVGSPKKKRAHDQLEPEDGDKAPDGEAKEEEAEGSVSSEGSGKDRASRLEPEKKRHRDDEPDTTTAPDGANAPQDSAKPQTQTSSSAFAASGFGKIASGTSPFASLGGGSAFGSGGSKLSSFASKPAAAPQPIASPPPVTLSFDKKDGVSPFGGFSGASAATKSNGFGSGGGLGGLGGGTTTTVFGSGLGSGIKPLSSFGGGGGLGAIKPIGGEKPAKPFGAPDSDVESAGEDEHDEDDTEEKSESGLRSQSPEKESDDKKKLKLQKVEVDDGEAGEATICSVRTKLFYMDKDHGWRERGAGMLKINVPTSTVDYDRDGHVIPGTFDASGLEDDGEDPEAADGGHKVVRLLMRQDQTHRILLNTVIVPAMKFQEKASLKSVGVLFTAFEGPEAKPVSMTMKMSAANAKTFMNDIHLVQRELSGN